MFCNGADLVRNQTVVIMTLCSLYHYHAEWPLRTEPCIKPEGCEPTAEVIKAAAAAAAAAAAPNNLFLLLRTTAVNQQISAWAHAET